MRPLLPKALVFSFLTVILFLCFLKEETSAIGPRNVADNGSAVKWDSMPVTVNVESDFDVRGKDVSGLVTNALNAWVDLTESDVTISQVSLGEAVDENNICEFFYDSSACPRGSTTDGRNPLVIDEDGGITAQFFGIRNKFTTLGFASIISYNSATGAAVKGEAVFNAACLATVMEPGCSTLGSGFTGFSDDDFTSFIVHEIGHFLGLDHVQVNLIESTDSDTSNDNLINSMFPTFIIGNGANFKVPKRDDQVALAQLYPASNFASNTWKISGTIYNTDGSTGLQCANLVARNVANPKVDAIAALSGDFAAAGASNGSFEIPGLTAGATYSLDIEPIGSGFTGASGYTPCRGSNGEDSPPSFASFTSSSTYSQPAGTTLTVDCTVGSGCTAGAVGGSNTGSTVNTSSGGCSLIPVAYLFPF